MKLKATYDKAEDVPDLYKDLFEEKDKKWVLTQIEGIQTDANVHRLEFALKKEREETAKLKEEAKQLGKTPDEVHALIEENEALKTQLETAGKPDNDQIEKLLEARLKSKLGPLERQIEKYKKDLEVSTSETQKLNGVIVTTKINDAVRKAATKANVLPTAISDLLLRAKHSFDVIDIDGKERVVTKDGSDCTAGLDPEGWLDELTPNAPHFFPMNQGAGAGGSGKGFGIPGNNPWSKKHWNMTEQGKVFTEHGADKAAKLAESVGSKIGATAPPKE